MLRRRCPSPAARLDRRHGAIAAVVASVLVVLLCSMVGAAVRPTAAPVGARVVGDDGSHPAPLILRFEPGHLAELARAPQAPPRYAPRAALRAANAEPLAVLDRPVDRPARPGDARPAQAVARRSAGPGAWRLLGERAPPA